MILTITINPLLERRITYEKTDLDKHNRNGSLEIKVGGKGINVSRQLNYLNAENFAFTFQGGYNGRLLRECLIKENIKSTAIHSSGETRECSIIIDKNLKKVFTFFSSDTKVSDGEVNEFMAKLEKMIENCEIVVFSGSSPCVEADIIFPYGIELAKKYDKISICDTYGRHLQNCLDKSPTIVHNNLDEIRNSLGIPVGTEEEKISFLNRLYEKGVKQAYLTDGEDNIYASNFDFHFKAENPKIATVDPTGSGDSFVAGIAYGWHNNLTFSETLSGAICLGAANAGKFDVCNVTEDEWKPLLDKVKISPVGKKMKTLDVTPR